METNFEKRLVVCIEINLTFCNFLNCLPW